MIISENILACSLTVLDISEYTHTRHCCSPIKNAQVPLQLQCFGWPENIKQNQNHRSSYSWCSLIYLQEYNHNIFFYYFLWRSLWILTWIIVKVCFLIMCRIELFFFVADNMVLSFGFNIVDSTAVFWILLNSTCTESPLSFFFPPLCPLRLGVLKKLDEGRTR